MLHVHRKPHYLYRVAKNGTTLVRPTAATIQDKIKRISLERFHGLREYRLGYNFHAIFKYSLQISSVIRHSGQNTNWASKWDNFTFFSQGNTSI